MATIGNNYARAMSSCKLAWTPLRIRAKVSRDRRGEVGSGKELTNRASTWAGPLYRMAGVDLTVLESIDPNTALVLLSEVGPDVSRFPTVKHFTSWLGLSPQHQGSAGKIRSRRVPHGACRAGRALRLAVQGCYHAKNALGAFYRRIQARAGAPKAIVATARKLGERVYRLLK